MLSNVEPSDGKPDLLRAKAAGVPGASMTEKIEKLGALLGIETIRVC